MSNTSKNPLRDLIISMLIGVPMVSCAYSFFLGVSFPGMVIVKATLIGIVFVIPIGLIFQAKKNKEIREIEERQKEQRKRREQEERWISEYINAKQENDEPGQNSIK